MKYKTFGELKEGDYIYAIDINRNKCKFNKYKISKFDTYLSTNDVIETYISSSPLSFDFSKNDSSWHSFIFTTKEEAINKAAKLISKEIKWHNNEIDNLNYLLTNIDEIDFEEVEVHEHT